jgi:hypothetical protein
MAPYTGDPIMTRPMLNLSVIFPLLAAAPLAIGQFDMSWYTIDGGGAMSSTGDTFSLSATIGQPDAQLPPVMSGGSYELTGGFWPVTQVCYCPGDLTGDGKKYGRDVQLFVSCMMSGGNCSCADVDVANGVNLADVPVFVNDLLNGPNCP